MAPSEYHGTLSHVRGAKTGDEAIYEDRFKIVKEVLVQFQHLSFIQELLEQYGAHAQAALVPKPFIDLFSVSLTDQVSACFNENHHSNERNLSLLAQQVIQNTSKAVTITPQTNLAGFVSMFSGENLRLETIGLLQCLAARSCYLGLARDNEKHEGLILALYKNTSSCLRLSRRLASNNNDVTIWLAFEYLRLTTQIEGESSPLIYRLVGDLSTVGCPFRSWEMKASDLTLQQYVHEFGIQRESSITRNTPFFVAECRRKTFAASFQFDKFVSALVDRPPRLLKRFSDCRMPLDLNDEELLSSETEEQARASLTADGWSPKIRYIPATWHRLRYMIGTLREEVLEYNYREPRPETEALIKQRCKRQKESLPPHLQYNKACWDSGLAPSPCLMLTVMHLSYLQVNFEIHRLLERCDPRYWEMSMADALEVVSVILHLGTRLDRATFLRYDFPYIVLGYGLPCVAVLANILQCISRNGGKCLPPNMKRATFVRALSVYLSHLDSICKPGDGEYNVCVQASQAISRVLDEVLDPPPTSSAVTTSSFATGTPTPVSTSAGRDSQHALAPAFSSSQPVALSVDEFDFLNVDGLEAFDLSSWVKNIDWTETGSEWRTF
ncbi:hypothetical protein A1O3_03726 [Capronia epimyces CBS 606.96]|uniref:Xylanolytic transcriptional activator regulatory domain-containing protein n=1 Tax=Capronia epimyces CBS 606.96 TaxID=1182542 RepID=W9Y1T6_9EURO|nr:uncharacterized protein A1O3_03726 [Capronia epimyces CBS 606.96]EXJ86772.1 hypothetical protein A1O3_03726 [Capronia epimyces CBS 606.96]